MTRMIILVFALSITAADYDGILFPSRQITISTLSSGLVISLPYREGQSVRKGDLLLAQDARKDSLNLILAQRKIERSAIEQTGEIENEIAASLQEIACQEKRIKAPFAGTITKVLAKENEYYSAGSKVIEFADISSLVTEIHVPKAVLEQLVSGKITVTVKKDKQEVKARYYSHNPLAEPGLELFMVKLILPDKFKWAPGSAVKISF